MNMIAPQDQDQLKLPEPSLQLDQGLQTTDPPQGLQLQSTDSRAYSFQHLYIQPKTSSSKTSKMLATRTTLTYTKDESKETSCSIAHVNSLTKETTGTGTEKRRLLYCFRCTLTDSNSLRRTPIQQWMGGLHSNLVSTNKPNSKLLNLAYHT